MSNVIGICPDTKVSVGIQPAGRRKCEARKSPFRACPGAESNKPGENLGCPTTGVMGDGKLMKEDRRKNLSISESVGPISRWVVKWEVICLPAHGRPPTGPGPPPALA